MSDRNRPSETLSVVATVPHPASRDQGHHPVPGRSGRNPERTVLRRDERRANAAVLQWAVRTSVAIEFERNRREKVIAPLRHKHALTVYVAVWLLLTWIAGWL